MDSISRGAAWRSARTVLCAVALLVCELAAIGGFDAVRAEPPEGYRGRRLAEVLYELERHGLHLIYSSAVVDAEQRIAVEPIATEPRAALDEVLVPFGLRAEDGPAGSILILPADTAAGRITGRVVVAADRRPVPDAFVRVAQTGDSATSRADGTFEIPGVPYGTYRITVDALGFETAIFAPVRVHADFDGRIDVELEPRLPFVTEVVVTPNRHSVVRETPSSVRTATLDEALLAPTSGGDITRAVELLPGVASTNNSAAFNVRGSATRDVALILDGLELYDPFHLQSFQSPFSLIDGNVVDRIDFFGGGFTADLGDRHGGFIDIRTVAPDQVARGEVELGTLNSRVSYQQSLGSGAGSWLVSSRAWYPDAVRKTTELGGSENLDPRFADLYAKIAFNVAGRHRISAHTLYAFDRLTFDESGEQTNEHVDALTRNAYGWIRALSVWSSRLTSQTLLSGGRIERLRNGLASQDGPVVISDHRDVEFFGLKHDSTLEISPVHAIKAGADLRRLDARYRYSSVTGEDPESSEPVRLDPDGTSLGVYAAYRVRVTPRIAVELGGRWDRQTHTADNQLSPRLNAVWRPAEGSELRIALGRFHQSQRLHELHVEDGETRFGPAEVAEQAEISFQHDFVAGPRVRIDAYYRELSALRPRYENLFEPTELFPEVTKDRQRIAPDEARLTGIELLVQSPVRRPLFWWFSYTRSSAEDRDADGWVPRSWDQPHAAKFLVGYRREGRWSLSLSGSAHSGWPTTPVSGRFVTIDGETTIEPVIGARNAGRFDTYLRFDLKARHAFELPRGRLWLTAEVLNLTHRDNACCIDEFLFAARPGGGIDTTRRLDYWQGITPTFSVLWEF